jgi:hypothetical protein
VSRRTSKSGGADGADGADQTLLPRTHGEKHVSAAPSAPSEYDYGDFPRGNPELYFVEADNLEAGGGILRALVDFQPSWRREALCRSQPLAIFFPIRGQSDKPGLAVCGPCPVRPECLAEAIAESLEHGIRGGLTGQARVAARKAKAANDTERAA